MGGRSMTYSLIVFGGLAQITASEGQLTPWRMVALVLVGLILFVAFTSFLALLMHRAFTESAQADRPHRWLIPTAWGFERGADPDAAPTDSVPHPRVLQPGSSTKSDPSAAGVARGRVHVPASPRPPLG